MVSLTFLCTASDSPVIEDWSTCKWAPGVIRIPSAGTMVPYSGRCQSSPHSIPETRNPNELYLINVDDVPRNKAGYIHFGQYPAVAQDCTFLCQRLLEFLDNVPSLIVLNEANNCIEQKQAGNDSQVDPVLQARSQYKRQLQKSVQLKPHLSYGNEPRWATCWRVMDANLQA